ncbi:hypothetical protein FNH71_18750 [Salmonella enterica subsp. diarizonae]|nr:hypothetical protein [Salmonella enterica subsp. diarizonae]
MLRVHDYLSIFNQKGLHCATCRCFINFHQQFTA